MQITLKNVGLLKGKDLTEEEILHLFDLCDAVWLHDGDPKKPHAELTSGLCSNGFFDCLRVLEIPDINEILAQQLARKIKIRCKVDWIIGSPYAAITFSYEVAKALKARHGFVEKDPSGKGMIWRRRVLPKGSVILQIEELITTSKTFKEVRRAVGEGNPEEVKFMNVVGTLVHRPPELPVNYDDGVEVVSLIERKIWAVEQKDCSLCKAGSYRLRPKTNWAELTRKNS